MFSLEKLLRDCRELFRDRVGIDQSFLFSLDLPAVKTAFRKRALATHPDRLDGLPGGLDPARGFIAATESYQRLCDFLRFKAVPRSIRTERPLRPRHPPVRPRRYEPQKVPAWEMRTAEFLYYSGVIPWNAFIGAITWQRQQRPRLGEIARRWGWVSEEDLARFLVPKAGGPLLGELLVQNGRLTETQLRLLLFRQKQLQEPIGRYFVQNGILSEVELHRFLADLKAHNEKLRRRG